MTLGEHIALLRKRKKLSQSDLGKSVGTSGDIIGRYERNLIMPSVEVIIKIADVLEVSIDYLVGKISQEIDEQTMHKLVEITKLPTEKKQYIFSLIDMCLRDFKTQQAYSS
jgi:transcriptional regulator with XRE-family HTH domain